ncbi:vacuolar membrane protein [Xylariomycetidae sp. FL0641]|nr:vacuolar membrane protein [Xylariomycetidae sp. FL0641]
MPKRSITGTRSLLLLLVLAICLLFRTAEASKGDRLPDFRECVKVCERENCDPNHDPTPIPLHRRLLLWTCPSECDYTCQRIVSARRRHAGQAAVQFHGKWAFARVLGIQEPLSVLFSLGNLYAHGRGLALLRARVPARHPLRAPYERFARVGLLTWAASALFHARDFRATEQADYFGAAAGVLCGLYVAGVRVLRLARPARARRRRAWTLLCAALYAAHVAYLKLWAWDYTYNMAANVAVGLVHNALWIYYSVVRYRETGREPWALWPAAIVAWIMAAMSLELFDFPPVWDALDAHSLWHLGTIPPALLWYQ